VWATGRKKLIIAGVSTEVLLASTGIHGSGIFYDAFVVMDASGTVSETKRTTGLPAPFLQKQNAAMQSSGLGKIQAHEPGSLERGMRDHSISAI
jgi:hypothetical protein